MLRQWMLNSLNKINRDLGDSRLKLSTGFKINNAEDDAAGFAMATKLKSRVAGLEQALQNVGMRSPYLTSLRVLMGV